MPPFIRSLWWKLAVANVLVTLAGSLLAVMVLGPTLDARVFRQIVKPAHLASLIQKERDLLGGRLDDQALVAGLVKVMSQRLNEVEGPHGMYGIVHSSEPRVSIAVYSDAGGAVARLEAPGLDLPTSWLSSNERLESVSDLERLLVLPLNPGGILVIRHFAEFSVMQNLRSTLKDAGTFLWFLILVVSIPGLAFGLGLTRWLTQRLRQMAVVSNAWSQGDFQPRMDERRSDELGQHARAMNAMATQLANHVRIEQELATLQERQRLARELHDGVKQQVFAAGLQMHAATQWLDRDLQRAREGLGQAQDINASIATSVAELLSRLQPGATTVLLGKALEQALLPWSGQVHLRVDAPSNVEVPTEVAHELTRIAAEAVSNAVRHADARRIDVRLTETVGHVRLEVVDDGHGFTTTHASDGMGLTSMRQRAALLHEGNLVVQSSASGTCVAVAFELEHKDNR
jgi:NarL family two-component system sensor histidine kinase LiaS